LKFVSVGFRGGRDGDKLADLDSPHFANGIAESLPLVCAKCTRAQTESDSLGAVLAPVTLFAKKLGAMLSYFSGVQKSITEC